MSFVGNAYRAVFRRTSTMLLVTAVGAVFFDRVLEITTDAIFDNLNKGKQWKDIKHKYEQ